MSTAYPLVPLSEVLIERRETPDASDLISGKIPIVEKVSFHDGRIHLRASGISNTKMILVQPGDLLVSGINAAKGAIAVHSASESQPIAATIHYGAYIPIKDRVIVEYLWWLLRSNTFRDLLQVHLPGGIKTELKSRRLLPIPIPLPPLDDQRRLVARIEELSAKIDEARRLRREVTANQSKLLTTMLTTIVGKEDVFGYLGDILIDKPRNGWSPKCDNVDSGTPVLSLSAVTGYRYKPSEHKTTSEPTSVDANYWLEPGDLLISRSNSPSLVGHAAIYDGVPSPCIYPDLLMRLRVNEKQADKRFVHWWLRSQTVRDFINTNAKGSSPTMKKISQLVVMQIPFPVKIPISEQRHIVSRLDLLQDKLDQTEVFGRSSDRVLDSLLPSVLNTAFNGDL